MVCFSSYGGGWVRTRIISGVHWISPNGDEPPSHTNGGLIACQGDIESSPE